MSQPTIFCDFDGPIVDVSHRYYATYLGALAKFNALVQVEGNQVEGKPSTIRHLSKTQFWTFKQNRIPDRQIAHWSGLEGDNIDRFLAEVSYSVNHASLLHYDRLQPRVREGLDIINQCGLRVVLVTLRSPKQVRDFLHRHQLEWAIADLFGMEAVDSAYGNRPDHKVERLQTAMAKQSSQGYNLRHALMIGDTEADIMAGQTLGIDTVAVTCGIRSSNYLQSFRPTRLSPDLWSVAQMLQRRTVLSGDSNRHFG